MLTTTHRRIALYGRHSTAMQSASSSADQVASCAPLVGYLGGTVTATWLDPELSGYRRDRPGLRQLLRAVETGQIDIIVCEALDRLARDAEDVAWLGKKLAYHRVQLHTVSEGHVDEIKFAVAGLLGSIFLKHLVDKTLRGMEAAVLAGRFAGGRAYGYKRMVRLDAKGEVQRGLLEIEEGQAAVVRRIFAWFAAGLSSIQIATRLNEEGVPGPRGGQWNASTIRGDPTKLVGILNNPLYAGRLVWGRRQWRKNPDSEKRERRYRLRDRTEWVEVAVPELRIVDDALFDAAHAEIERRKRAPQAASPAGETRARHLLSGLIRCSCCGANYTISGKDYYRCAGQKERGTCRNRVSVRKGPLETATLATLQEHLLTDEHVRVFIEEFERELQRLTRQDTGRHDAAQQRLQQVTTELDNLYQNLLAGIASPALRAMITEREAEKLRLKARTGAGNDSKPTAILLPHPVLVEQFRSKVAALRQSLDDASIRTEAAAVLSTLIESVTIFPDEPGGPEAEVVAKVSDLLTWATNDNAARKGGVSGSISVVAGTGFEPVTFRL
ncbi:MULTISPECIES: recombinase family protein [unclassified Sphingomonas]|uniref:recombinase family protein n=1 Tax=unclassified Sphingomonas TaxID=196159 RepID=UPI0007014994|nr:MULTISPECIES: recombinase family protein [unclassified Sphingomonas]MBD8552809.1 recombinase family protein [Sphingomonas sp. CFBP 8764]